MDPTSLQILLAAIPIAYEVVRDIIKLKTSSRDLRQAAVDALTMAVGNTDAYLKHLKASGHSIRAWEERLSDDWLAAHHAVRAVLKPEYGSDDDKKVNVLELKGFYWRDPTAWSAKDVKRARIELSTVKRELSKFIDPDKIENPKSETAQNPEKKSKKRKSKGG